MLFGNESNFTTWSGNATFDGFDDDYGNQTCQASRRCINGLILPLWLPEASDAATIAYRAIIYGAALIYLLFGVSIITERLVSCTEVMAVHKRSSTAKLRSGGTATIKVLVWHPIVASLTFEVIGTSSPEILLPLIEIFHSGFVGDALGPSLIIGSAAYHLFLITSFCLLTVRDSSGKPIKDLPLFFTTATFAITGYLWVFLLLDKISPAVIELWEALVTLLMFPILVASAWAVSCRYPQRIFWRCRRALRGNNVSPAPSYMSTSSTGSSQIDEPIDESRRRSRLAGRLKILRVKFPSKTQSELEEIAKLEMLEDIPHGTAYYRLLANKSVAGTRKIVQKIKHDEALKKMESFVQKVGFTSTRGSCLESCGEMVATVERWGAGVSDTSLTLDFHTTGATAKPNVNFVPISGRLAFGPGQSKAEIHITILDDNIFEETAKFFLIKISRPVLSMPRMLLVPGHQPSAAGGMTSPKVTRVEMSLTETTISILDDDHCGVFAFEKQDLAVADNIRLAKIKVVRTKGTKGRIAIPYRISPGLAKPGVDYMAEPEGVLQFIEGQSEDCIEIAIVDKDRFGEVFTFHVELMQPKKVSPSDVKSTVGMPRLGHPNLVQVGICESEEMKEALDRLLKTPEIPAYVVSSTWKDQFRDILTIYVGDDLDHNNVPLSCFSRQLWQQQQFSWQLVGACAIHVLALPWKLAIAILPPARLFHGWVAYFSLLGLMALVAALIGDCTTHFACTVGLKDTIAAIALIPFGMCLPDTFASRRAAQHEKTADAAIGTITGANAVAIYLGMGLSWTIAALYQTAKGDVLRMPTMNLGFDVIVLCSFASVGIIVLLLRRLPPIRGELGGPFSVRILSALFFILLWLLFVILSILEHYCIIPRLKA